MRPFYGVSRERATDRRGPQTKTPARGRGFLTNVTGRLRVGVGSGRLGAIDELDVRHRRGIAGAEAALEDPQVAARTRAVAWADLGEELADGFLVADARHRDAAVRDAVFL